MSEWVKCGGRECPVHIDTMVDVVFRNGDKTFNSAARDLLSYWIHTGHGADIVRYRLSSNRGSTEEAYEDADRPVSESVLDEAARIVAGKRATDYGKPERNFNRIARFWSVYLDKEITPIDVCQMMILLKQARLKESPRHRDSQVDIAGYAALIEIINGGE